MHKTGLFLILLTLVSCEYFSSNKVSKEEIVRKEIQSINWDDIDRYPLFDDCDETATKYEQRRCFQSEFSQKFFSILKDELSVAHKPINDTVRVQLLIERTGTISMVAVVKNEYVARVIPDLDSIVKRTIAKLPKVYPALKRDIPVNTRVVLPLVLRVETEPLNSPE
ncbi:energy transducer TonB [Robertkochia solimangrovi]|uniref:energy transducer TonB n=1 Tax=Robertkochia solimangrovi TaxID=2213046 RepID=UPI001180BAE0|nr:hypothetical protein [Robertkochia solimangrovi]TRZ46355.1 hypothetical protein DMZ48_03625 [Robertkochia solimangrovi]